MKQVTLLFLRTPGQVLLAMKKRGFGAGKWNGVGGKVDPGESIIQATIRECQEEIGVTPHAVRQIGYLDFFDQTDPDFHHACSIFVADSWDGEPIETEEMRPEWFAEDTIPFDVMWPDDEYWFPYMLAGTCFKGTVIGSEDTLVTCDLTETTAGDWDMLA